MGTGRPGDRKRNLPQEGLPRELAGRETGRGIYWQD